MRFLVGCLVALLLPLQAYASGISLSEKDGTLMIILPSEAPAKVMTLTDPPRIAIDFPSATRPALELPNPLPNGITNVRSGQFNASTSRVVIDLDMDVVTTVSQTGKTLLIDMEKRATGFKVAGAKPKKGEEKTKKPMIIIDAGHGGQDPGASGEGGTREKDVVLDYAFTLSKALQATRKYDVTLTRDSDFFIPLRERVAMARKAKGDVFISLHADSAGNGASGLSVYTLSETASDKEAEALAARENRSDIIAGLNLNTHDEDVANILISLAQRETNTHSASLADSLVVGMLKYEVELLENAHRFAGFAVLKAPDIPSVLIETGFISNPKEEKKLKTSKHREKVVAGIVAGVNKYFERLKATEKKLP